MTNYTAKIEITRNQVTDLKRAVHDLHHFYQCMSIEQMQIRSEFFADFKRKLDCFFTQIEVVEMSNYTGKIEYTEADVIDLYERFDQTYSELHLFISKELDHLDELKDKFRNFSSAHLTEKGL